MSNQIEEQTTDNWQARTILIGTALGALVGAGAAYLMIQQATRQEKKVSVSAGAGVRLGLLVFGLLRQIALLGEDE